MLKNRRAVTVLIWGIVALLLWPYRGKLERELRATNPVANSESARADSLLLTEFRGSARETALLVINGLPVRADSQAGRTIVRRIVTGLQSVKGVGDVTSPASSLDTMLVGANGKVALALVRLNDDDPTVIASLRERTEQVLATERSAIPALTLQWTGQPAVLSDLRTSGAAAATRAELYAFPLTLLVAWWAFASLGNALTAVFVAALVTVIGAGVMGLLSVVFPPSVMARSIVSLVGLALTVDYMLLMTRTRAYAGSTEQRHARQTAMLAAVIVATGFVGLTVAPTGELRTTAVTGALVALLAALGAITLGRAGTREPAHSAATLPPETALTPDTTTPATAVTTTEATRWFAWGARVTRHPVLFALASAIPLLLLANHARTAILSTPLDNWLPKGSESTQALDLLKSEQRLGLAGTARVLLRLPHGTTALSPQGWATIKRATEHISTLPHTGRVYTITTIGTGELLVAQQVFPAAIRDRYVSKDGQHVLLEVVPPGGSETAEAIALAHELRLVDASVVPGLQGSELLVSGLPAYSVDYQDATRSALPWVVLAASVATFVALLLALRAPLVALKAVSLNLLVAAAAMGATVYVFQDGIGIEIFNREAVGSILPTVPLLGFAATFGISMDYELFLLNAVRNMRRAGQAEGEAIARGLADSAGLITRAACVMAAVFAAFAMSDLLPLSMLGFALVTAVLLDATLVRLVLAPALLTVAGRWNWWPADGQTGSRARKQTVPPVHGGSGTNVI